MQQGVAMTEINKLVEQLAQAYLAPTWGSSSPLLQTH
ncbi:hypothetical protein DEU50_11266 [Aeromonas salmonicida]|uniref:Uncharacterized protein n=1 Tax=Aeromonas salmonicida TaxID=645 RepID=A0AAX1PK72_AERSA|nr:hypothetical protein DEU50_11266 [Aeromonas salmonicida]